MRCVLSIVLLLLVGCTGFSHADLVLLGGQVITLDEKNPTAVAIATRGGKIIYVGKASRARHFVGPSTEIIDLEGATVLPGFTDAHMHLSGVGAELLSLNLKGTQSLADFLQQVAMRVAKAEPDEWIVGRGWIETFWKPPVFPSRHDLDAVAPDHPVYLSRVDGHGAVVNTRALSIAGITADTEDPPGGQILRDPDGNPTGMLLDNAMGFVARHLPDQDSGHLRRTLILGSQEYAKRGWTGVQIAGTSWREAEIIRELVDEGEIPIRIYNAIMGPGRDAERLIQEGPMYAEPQSLYTRRTIKVSYDGALGSGGAALLAPYADRDGSGFLKHTDDALLPMFEGALRHGIQLEVHAIGDRANRRILDLFEQSFETVAVKERTVADPRWRVEHAQIVDPEDIPRFAALGVIPSMQPSHAISDLHFAPSRLGPDRLVGAYAWRTFLDQGSIIPGGSDAPVEAGEPLVEFYAAVARADLQGFADENWHQELAMTRDEALKMLTIWPAEAAFEEEWRGTIQKGKACDLTILDRNPLTVPIDDIPRIRCLWTVVAGRVVHGERAADE